MTINTDTDAEALRRYGLTVGDRCYEDTGDGRPEWVVEPWGLRGVTAGADDWDWQGIDANGGLGIVHLEQQLNQTEESNHA